MKIVPVIKSAICSDRYIFYTEVLDFERKWPGHEDLEMQRSHRPGSGRG